MILLKDDAFDDILAFFDAAAHVGREINATVNPLENANSADPATKRTVAKEARLLKKFYLKMRD